MKFKALWLGIVFVSVFHSPMSQAVVKENNSAEVKLEQQGLKKFDNWIDQLNEKKAVSGTFLIAHRGKVVYSKAVGIVHPDRPNKITLNSSFNLGSISKQFTAMGIMLLKQENKLSFDDKVQAHLTEFPYKNITIRHLLNHTSGLPDYMDLAEEHWDPSNSFKNQDMLDLLSKHQPALEFTPNSKFEYSNTGYVTLSAIIERVSKKSFETFMDEHVFIPLDMKSSKVVNLVSKPNNLPSRVYGQHKDKLDDLVYLDGVSGDGAVYSTVGDLLKWHQALSSNALLSAELQQQAFKPLALNDKALSNYGFGWFIKSPDIVGHAGNWLGFNADFVRNTAEDTVLIMLTNKTGGEDFWDVRDRFIAAYDQSLNIDYDSFFE